MNVRKHIFAKMPLDQERFLTILEGGGERILQITLHTRPTIALTAAECAGGEVRDFVPTRPIGIDDCLSIFF